MNKFFPTVAHSFVAIMSGPWTVQGGVLQTPLSFPVVVAIPEKELRRARHGPVSGRPYLTRDGHAILPCGTPGAVVFISVGVHPSLTALESDNFAGGPVRRPFQNHCKGVSLPSPAPPAPINALKPSPRADAFPTRQTRSSGASA